MRIFLLFVTLIIINPALHAEEKKAYFAGGCFWCMEESFDQVEGVISTISGYSGGHLKNPKYADVIYFVGVKLFGGVKTKSNHGELLRTIGFSSAPGLIRVFGITPELMTVTFIGSAFWMLACMVVAVKAALDYESLWKAFGVVVVSWLFQAFFLFLVIVLFKGI